MKSLKSLFFVSFILAFSSVASAVPFFCEKTAYVEGKALYTVGVSLQKTESEARKQAFANAKQEIFNYFQQEVSLQRLETQRTVTERRGDQVYVCRLLKVDMSKLGFYKLLTQNKNKIGLGSDFISLKIYTTPTEAQVYIDGKLIGNSNLDLSAISTGQHRLSIAKNGYKSIEKNISIGNQSELSFNLEKKKTKVVLQSDTPDHQIILNNKEVLSGKKSYEVWLPIDTENRLLVEAPEYYKEERSFSISSDQRKIVLELNLKPKPGSINVITSPNASNVFIDGKLIGPSPINTSLSAGRHEIKIEKLGFKEEEFAVQIEAGENKSINLIELEAITEAEQRQINSGWSFHIGFLSPPSTLKNYKSALLGMGLSVTKRLNSYLSLGATLSVSGGTDNNQNTSQDLQEQSIYLQYLYTKEFLVGLELGNAKTSIDSSNGTKLLDGAQEMKGVYWGYMTSPEHSLGNGFRALIGLRSYNSIDSSYKGNSGFYLNFDYFWNW